MLVMLGYFVVFLIGFLVVPIGGLVIVAPAVALQSLLIISVHKISPRFALSVVAFIDGVSSAILGLVALGLSAHAKIFFGLTSTWLVVLLAVAPLCLNELSRVRQSPTLVRVGSLVGALAGIALGLIYEPWHWI